MAAPGNPGAMRAIHITFYPKRDYKNPALPHPVQERARDAFIGDAALPVHWDTIRHDQLQGMNEAQAFAGWSGKGRREATIAGPGPHAVIFRRNWLPPKRWIDGNPRCLVLPNCPQKVLDAVFAEGLYEPLAAAFWYAWELGRSGRHRLHREQSVGGWDWGLDEFDVVLETALRLALMFPDEPCLDLLKALPVF